MIHVLEKNLYLLKTFDRRKKYLYIKMTSYLHFYNTRNRLSLIFVRFTAS